MDESTYKKIKAWIFEQHDHHGTINDIPVSEEGDWIEVDSETICSEGDYPYVNSLALEGFVDSLVDASWAASYQYRGGAERK